MPNLDTGTYFLTILAPVRTGPITPDSTEAKSNWNARFHEALSATATKGVPADPLGEPGNYSWVQRLRTVLATLPTALQSPATIEIGIQSPFARNTRNHLCRFAVIENAIYNGRTQADPLLGKLPLIGKFFGGSGDVLVPQEVDNLDTPYLMFAADIDAVTEDGAQLPANLGKRQQDEVRDSYLRTLWETAQEEMQAIFENCVGFESVTDADSFITYMKKCQVETTMPFHDYWTSPPNIPRLPVGIISSIILIPAAIFLLAVLCWLFGLGKIPLVGWNTGAVAAVTLLLTAAAVAISYVWAIRQGNAPFPPAEHGDLPSVLKALYLQQKFADFVIANQGAEPAKLHEAFGKFLEDHKPSETAGPTQRPGYISSSEPDAVRP